MIKLSILVTNKDYKTIKEFIYNPPTFEEEIRIREKITLSLYDLTPIITTSDIVKSKLTIYLDSKTYEDTRERYSGDIISFL